MDDMIARGCRFAWNFTYMPVGKDAVTDLLATSEQRAYMYRRTREIRETKPIFAMDFWNDGEYTQGCIAGGRRYLHINAAGEDRRAFHRAKLQYDRRYFEQYGLTRPAVHACAGGKAAR